MLKKQIKTKTNSPPQKKTKQKNKSNIQQKKPKTNKKGGIFTIYCISDEFSPVVEMYS